MLVRCNQSSMLKAVFLKKAALKGAGLPVRSGKQPVHCLVTLSLFVSDDGCYIRFVD